MKKVIFVAPFFMDATERFIDAATKVPDAHIGLVSCDPVSKLSTPVRKRLSAHCGVKGITTSELLAGVEKVGRELGGIDRIMGMLEQIQVSLGEIRDHLGIPGMGAVAANNFRDKSVMKSVLRESGLPCARHALVTSPREGLEFASQSGYPVIVKPPAGAGAKGTYRIENEQRLAECLNFVKPSQQTPTVLEEFVIGQEHSFDSICLQGKMLWSSISHYWPGPLDVVREPWIQWTVVIPRETDLPQYQSIKKIAPAALSALGMQTGLSHMEWFLRPDGSVAISEVGARPPGAQFTSLISYAHDFNLYKAWAELVIHENFQMPVRKYAVGAAYLRGMGRGSVAHVHGLDEIAKSLGKIVVEANIPESGQKPSGSYEGEGYIIVRHENTEIVENAVKKIIETIHVELTEKP